jgi:hypothetical protein
MSDDQPTRPRLPVRPGNQARVNADLPTLFGLAGQHLRSRSIIRHLFVYTDQQVFQLASSWDQHGAIGPTEWSASLFTLAQARDEFSYLTRDQISVRLDSKQNFDENYQSNWFYYLR